MISSIVLAGFQGSQPAAAREPRRVLGVARPHPPAGALAVSPNLAPPLAPQRQMGSPIRRMRCGHSDARAEGSPALGPTEDSRQCGRSLAGGLVSHLPDAAANTAATSTAAAARSRAPLTSSARPTAVLLGWTKPSRPTAAAATSTLWQFSSQSRECGNAAATAPGETTPFDKRRAAGTASAAANDAVNGPRSTADGCVGAVPARAAEKQEVGLGAIARAPSIASRNAKRRGTKAPKHWQLFLQLRCWWWWGLLAWIALGETGRSRGRFFVLVPGAEAVGFTIQFGGNHRRGGAPGGDESDDEQQQRPSPVRELYSEIGDRGGPQRPLELTNGEAGANNDGSSIQSPPQPSFGVPGAIGDSSSSGSAAVSSSSGGVALGPADPTSAWFYAWQTTCAWAAETFVRPVRKASAQTTGKRGFFSRKVRAKFDERI